MLNEASRADGPLPHRHRTPAHRPARPGRQRQRHRRRARTACASPAPCSCRPPPPTPPTTWRMALAVPGDAARRLGVGQVAAAPARHRAVRRPRRRPPHRPLTAPARPADRRRSCAAAPRTRPRCAAVCPARTPCAMTSRLLVVADGHGEDAVRPAAPRRRRSACATWASPSCTCSNERVQEPGHVSVRITVDGDRVVIEDLREHGTGQRPRHRGRGRHPVRRGPGPDARPAAAVRRVARRRPAVRARRLRRPARHRRRGRASTSRACGRRAANAPSCASRSASATPASRCCST